MATQSQPNEVQSAMVQRTGDIVEALVKLDEAGLAARSELAGWSRLTIACHLRYGAETLHRMTSATLAGRPTAYYPEGRQRQRAGTLRPHGGEGPHAVVTSMASRSRLLTLAWSTLDAENWNREINEPADNPDLGPITFARLALLRLTEVEVHGSDLGVHLDDWSTTFVTTALPMRLECLNVRRVSDVAARLEGSWLLVASDGPTYRVSVAKGMVESIPAAPHAPTTGIIEATSRDLLSLLLGRAPRQALRIGGDLPFAEAFSSAFPGP